MATDKSTKGIKAWNFEKVKQKHNGYNYLRIYHHYKYKGNVFIREISQRNFTNLENKEIKHIFRYPFARQFKKSLGHLKPQDRQYNSREQIAKQVANIILDEWLKMIMEKIIEGRTYSCKNFDIKVGYRLMANRICDFTRDGRIYFPIINIKRGFIKRFRGCAMMFSFVHYKIFKEELLNGKTYSMPLTEIKRKEYYLIKAKEYVRLHKQQ